MKLFGASRARSSASPAAPAQPDADRKPLYLVSTAGHPNYGDELITRAWLDHLAARFPDREVWLDCPHPGRAAHLFARTHPRLRLTDTLWELALGSDSHDPVADAARIERLVRDLGSPRFDAGLLALREMDSIHLLGGGYLNTMWQDNLGLVTAMAAVREAFGVRVFATGLGLMPLMADGGADLAPWLRDRFAGFEHVEVRDEPSAAAIGAELGLDDAFLALAQKRRAFDERRSPDRMVLVQGDLRAWGDDAALATIESFLAGISDASVGFAEAVPPDDHRYRERALPDGRFYAFGHIWADGLPARAGQRWLTSRFHVHLMAAAAGAAGLVVMGRPGYYDVKHESLFALGTGWTAVRAGDRVRAEDATVDPAFGDTARELAARKAQLADRLYAS